ncbi:MAG: fatty-acyl-CoA synthase [Actinomycetota bacterium]|nr:fatty-acyl-CoA synthase [Actinomycetota bacterium]
MSLSATVEVRRRSLEERTGAWRARRLDQALDGAAVRHPDRPLVITDESTYAYADIVEWSGRLARGLASAGVTAGDHVAVLLANYPEFVALKFAIARLGAVSIPVNYLLRRDELGFVLGQSDAVALVTMNRFRDLDYLAALDELAPGWERNGGGARFPRLRQIIAFATDADPRPGVLSLEDLAVAGDGAAELPAVERDAGSPCDVIYTSGTTGTPKGVILTHDMVLRTAYASAYTRAFGDGRRILFSLPLYHVFGYVEGLSAALFVGGAIIPQLTFDPVATLAAVEEHRADEVIFVPTMTLAVLDVARRKSFDLSSLSVVFSSGGQSPARVWSEVRDLLGADEIFTGYGMTETTASTTCTFPDDPVDRLITSNGRCKPAGVAGDPDLGGVLARYKAVDPVTGAVHPVGEVGDLVVRGPIVTPGYYERPDETAAAFDANGWLRTGDLGRIDGEGFLSLTGRKKECYRCGGELVVPKEVEDLLTAHPGVAQAHVVPIPDERMGEVGVVWVVPEADAELSGDALLQHCAERLARFKVPTRVFFVDVADLPASASGKVQKFKLVERTVTALQPGRHA